jgi:ferredoxin-2, mitochondrial
MKSVNVTYILRDGQSVKIRGKVGDNVMYLAHRHKIPIEGISNPLFSHL